MKLPHYSNIPLFNVTRILLAAGANPFAIKEKHHHTSGFFVPWNAILFFMRYYETMNNDTLLIQTLPIDRTTNPKRKKELGKSSGLPESATLSTLFKAANRLLEGMAAFTICRYPGGFFSLKNIGALSS